MKTSSHKLTHCAVLTFIVVLVLYAYGKIGGIAFYLDDFSSIVNNPAIQSPLDIGAIWQTFKSRFVSYLGFALQSYYFADNPEAFHWVGFLLHVFVSLSFALLSYCVFAKALSREHVSKSNLVIACMASAGIFLLHPQNSQAVIYIVQQSVLWMTLFYLLALWGYFLLRSQDWSLVGKMGGAFLIVLLAIVAILSKQTAATLPLAILLVEWVFFGAWLKRLLLLFSIVAASSLVAVLAINGFNLEATLSFVDNLSRETSEIGRLEYFLTQSRVLFHYIGQYFSLSGFRLEYDFVLDRPQSIGSYAFVLVHILFIGVAVWLKKHHPVLAFGILFYYLAHSVESSVFPIRDLAFEHRAYLPNLGLALVVSYLFYWLLYTLRRQANNRLSRLAAIGGVGAVFVLVAHVTHVRVGQWSDYKAFYENEIHLSPNAARANAELGTGLAQEGNCPKAIGYISHAIALYKNKHQASLGLQPETALNYVICLRKLGIDNKAELWEQNLLEQVKEPIRRAQILAVRGTHYLDKRDFVTANQALSESVQLNNKDYAAVINLAVVRVNIGDIRTTEILLKHALRLKPGDEVALNLLDKLTKMKKSKE